MKISKKIVIPVVAVALIGAAVFALPNIVNGSASNAVSVSATPLVKMDLKNSVSVTGTVKSEEITNVYSTLAYQVQTVNVEVGDSVNVGDVLCVLDTADLKVQIEQQEISLANSQSSAQHNVAVAQNNLATQQNNQQYDYDTAYENAKKTVETAQRTLESQQSTLEKARNSLTQAGHQHKASHKALQDYRDSYGTPTEYDATYEQLYQSYVSADLSLTNAENTVADAEKAVKNAEKDLEKAKENAEAAFAAALRQQQATLTSSQQQVKSAQISAANVEVSAMQLDELKKNLEKANVTAPVSGTVTAVMAVEGGSGQGLLFVIENTGKLKIDTKIEEYDVPYVKAGQPAKIKSDGTGDEEYEGKVTRIAPTAIKAANGATVETTDVQFATEVGIVGISDLKIGMNARIDIVTESKPDVFAVSYDAVVENPNGESVVYVARPQGGGTPPVSMSKEEYDKLQAEGEEGEAQIAERRAGQQTQNAANGAGSFVAVAIPVKTGMETDFYIEIIADSLKEGDLIISNPAGIADGQAITLGGAGARGAAAGAMGGMGGPQAQGGMAVRMG